MAQRRQSKPVEEAQRQLEQAVKLSPDFADARTILGDLFARRGAWPAAMACYREALRIKPDSGRAHLGLGTALGATGDPAGARDPQQSRPGSQS